MAVARTWNIRLNLDEFNALTSSLYTDADRAIALQGLALGMNAGECPENVPDAFRRGWLVGAKAREATEDIRRRNAEIGSRGGRPAAGKQPGNPPENPPPPSEEQEPNGKPNGYPDGKPNGTPEGPPNGEPYPITNNEEQKNEERTPLTPQGERPSRPRAPTEEEWVQYCRETWPDWHPTCAAESWAYYRSVGWRTRAGAIKDWRAAARTSYGNAREWGKLQPKNGPPYRQPQREGAPKWNGINGQDYEQGTEELRRGNDGKTYL